MHKDSYTIKINSGLFDTVDDTGARVAGNCFNFIETQNAGLFIQHYHICECASHVNCDSHLYIRLIPTSKF